jgi:hypothetical protein
MPKFDSPLNNIRVASPCKADWDQMYGDGRKRFCGDCKLNVYNLSGMTRDEAEALIMNAQGRLCVRFYRRADGTVLTNDCPVGWAKVKQRTRLILAAGFSMVVALFTGVLFASLFGRHRATMGDVTVGVMAMPSPTPRVIMGAVRPTMGNIAVDVPQLNPNSNFEMGKMRVLDGEKRSGT